MSEYGYCRVSSTGQNLDRQIEQLRQYVKAENIITDKQSGKDLERPGYQALKGALGLRKGDTLYITSLDRLSRNKSDIKNELQWFKENGIRLMILDLPSSMIEVPDGQEWILEMINNILIEVLSSMAEQERLTIRKRQAEGIAIAKKEGKYKGGTKKTVDSELLDSNLILYRSGKITKSAFAKNIGVSRPTLDRILSEYAA